LYWWDSAQELAQNAFDEIEVIQFRSPTIGLIFPFSAITEIEFLRFRQTLKRKLNPQKEI